MILVHVIMEADKSFDLPGSLQAGDPGKPVV